MNQEKYEAQKQQIAIRKSRSGGLALVKKTKELPDNIISGKVCSIIGNKVLVEVSNSSDRFFNNKKIYECVPAGTIVSKNSNLSNLLATGDEVWFSPEENMLSSIVKIEIRENFFSRQDPSNRRKEQILAANINNVIIFFSILEPTINIKLIDRFLIAATLGGVTPVVCINKVDLVESSIYKNILKNILAIYKKNNIEVFTISATEKTGLEKIIDFMKNKENLITGPSGVGKSTFLNAILGYEAQVVSEISDRTNKGTHTTSFSKRYIFDEHTAIIDTPGLREFGLWNLTKEELPLFFYDFLPFINSCYFTPCSHTHEPRCAVKSAVERGEIFIDRYESYLNIYDSLENKKNIF